MIVEVLDVRRQVFMCIAVPAKEIFVVHFGEGVVGGKVVVAARVGVLRLALWSATNWDLQRARFPHFKLHVVVISVATCQRSRVGQFWS